MKKPVTLALAMAAAAVLGACGSRPEPPVAAPAASLPATAVSHIDGIAWFDGELDAAFAAAAAQHKLVFLYWGAEWCPPCHDLKAHVFSRRDFQDKLRQFVPVYLDGDAAGAQRAGSQFQVMGYPTVVVLDAARNEIARIAGGMDLGSYADVLDLALEGVRPLSALLAALRTDKATQLSEADCRRLAFNGWGLDPRTDTATLAADLELAAQGCPATAGAERDRLIVNAADFAASEEVAALESGKAAGARLARLVPQVETILADRGRSLATADAFLYLGGDFFVVARKLAPQRVDQLRDNWFALMDVIEADARYSDTMRLTSADARLRAAKSLAVDGTIPPAVATRARATLDAYLARDFAGYSRAGIINAAAGILDELGDDARLKDLLLQQVQVSKTPYYYFPDIADLEEKAGHKEAALSWFERGYRESAGPATRFQWGTLYINGLLRISPQDAPRIRTAVLDVIGELDGPERIHARARARLDKLNSSLADWAEQYRQAPTLTAVRQRWQQICQGLPATDSMRTECPGLLAAGS
ncbi:MAG: thioredoxin family protein [Steroidobacteraceae bacterium]